jgi:hypothetical protein
VLGLGVRWLLHELLDPSAAYPPMSTLEVARVELEATPQRGVAVEEATLLRLARFGPASRLQSPVAWKLEVGARRLALDGASRPHLGVEIGLGLGAALRSRWTAAAYSMLGARPGVMLSSAQVSFLPAALWSTGVLLHLAGGFRAHVAGEYVARVTRPASGAVDLRGTLRKSIRRDLDLELTALGRNGASGATLGLVLFH